MRFRPDYWAGPLDSTCELLEVKSANLILSILLQPRQLRLGLFSILSRCFWSSPYQAPAQNLGCVKSLTVIDELDGNGIFPNKINEWQKCHLCHVWFIVFSYLVLKCHCLRIGKLFSPPASSVCYSCSKKN